MPDLVTIKTYETYIAAQIVKGRLEDDGIECFLKDEESVTMYWLWSNALGGVKLQVKQEDETLAKNKIEIWEQEATEDSDTPAYWEDNDDEQLNPNNRVCIHCGSKNTHKIGYSKPSAAFTILLLGFPLLFRSNKWHCFHCGEDF